MSPHPNAARVGTTTDSVPVPVKIFPGDAAEGATIVGGDPAARGEGERHGLRVLAILSALMGFASISTDFYLPALPTMAGALRSDAGTMDLTISGYLVGFSLGQLFWGPIGDRYGRRGPIAVGLILFVIGSAGCALSGSAAALIGWRLLQALGACAGVVLARAMVRDLYAGSRAAQMMSTLMTVMAIAPLIGPIMGGQLLVLSGWRAIFWTLVGVGICTLATLFMLPETLPPSRRSMAPLSGALRRYTALLSEPRLLGYAGAGGFLYAGLFAYIAGTPFAYITYHHLPPQLYGLIFGAGVIGIMVTNMINARLVASVGTDTLLLLGTAVAMASGLTVAATAWTDAGGLWGLTVPLFFFISATGLIIANSIAGALSGFPERAGAVSALVGAMQYGSGIVGSALVGALADGTPRPMALVIAVASIGSLGSAWLLTPARKRGLR